MSAQSEQLFLTRYGRFLLMARGGSFATRLAHGGVVNEGGDHKSKEMIDRSRRSVDANMDALFDATQKLAGE